MFSLKFIDTNGPFAVKEGKEEFYRKGVVAIIKNVLTDEYLYIEYLVNDRIIPNQTTLVGGGVEENEDLEVAVKREVQEETGFVNTGNLRHVGNCLCQYYSKDLDRNVNYDLEIFEVDLLDMQNDGQLAEDVGKIAYRFCTKEELLDKVSLNTHRYILSEYFKV